MTIQSFAKANLIALAVLPALVSMGAAPAFARHQGPPQKEGFANETPKQLEDIGIEERLGGKIDLDLKFKNEAGELVPLRSFFQGHKPVLLSLAYYGCPSLCNFHLNGLNDSFKQIEQPIGAEFNFVVISIEPNEKPELAASKKAAYIKEYGRPEGAAGWHFLTGDEKSIQAIAGQVGFKYKWDEQQKQWAHAAAAYAITPEGRISRYLYGIVFNPKTLRLSMVEASNGRIGDLMDRLILFCFHFDPKASKYTFYVFNLMRAGAVLIVLVIAGFLVPFWLRNRREERSRRRANAKPLGLQGES